ncbi:hypothetical protein [Mucilaginibacter pedocola]|uniref:Uncharacterized protein n=1 Tax=Mucilaginibacter pedocola TaxID=1792845 RepID=A0A1S9PIP2_9SPHI|nr:hypothetical protein [Mucilaginibacter pedocola]OOQ60797.1 hypothetical protein BC343_22750 [Mucilaginibacter pedocola]
MNFKKLFTLAFCLSVFATTASAQFMHQRDYRLITTSQYTDVEGSPYLFEDWEPGSVTLVNGVSSTEQMQLKYNVVDDVLTFKDKASGEEMAFVQKVKEFKIAPNAGLTDAKYMKLYRSGFTGIEGTTADSFFEVLADGKAQLLKRFTKVVFESQDIGSASKKKTFLEKEKYYIIMGGKATVVKNDKKSILSVLADKQPQLEDYIKTNKVSFKSDAQVGKLVDYYNTL